MDAQSYYVPDEDVLVALPERGFLRNYVQYAKTQTDASLAFHVVTGLVCLATLIPPDVKVWSNGGYLRPNLYTLLVGDSVFGRKSTVIKIMRSVLDVAARERMFPGSPESWQGIMKILVEQSKQLTVVEPEFARFLRSSGGQGYLMPLKNWYIDAYDGTAVGRSAKETTVAVDWTSISMVAGVAPVHIEDSMSDSDFEGGFWARFVVARGQSGEYRPYNPKQPKMIQYLQDMATFYMEQAPTRITVPEVVPLDDAQSIIAANGESAHKYAKGLDEHNPLRGIAGRAQLVSTKIALLLAFDEAMHNHWCEHRGETVPVPPIDHIRITADIAHRAWLITKLHVKSAEAVANSMAANNAMRARRKVLNAARSAYPKAVSLGHLAQAAHMLIKEVRPVVDTVVEQKLLVRIGDGAQEAYQATPLAMSAKREAPSAAPPAPPTVAPVGGIAPPAPTPAAVSTSPLAYDLEEDYYEPPEDSWQEFNADGAD